MARIKFIEDKDIVRRSNSLNPYIPFKDFAAVGDKSSFPNFTVAVTEEKAEELIDAGYKIKEYRNDDGEVFYQLRVNIRYNNFPPKIFKIPEGKKRKFAVDEDMIKDFQNDTIVSLDMSVSLSKGGACYISSGYFTVGRNPIDDKYDFDEEDDVL